MGNSTQQDNFINHPIFGKFHLTHDQLIVRRKLRTPFDIEFWTKRMPPHKISGLFIPFSYQVVQPQTCNQPDVLQLHFNPISHSLQQQLYKRHQQKFLYSQREIRLLLKQLLQISFQAAPFIGKIGDIQPCNILLDGSRNLYCVSTLSWPDELSGFRKQIVSNQTSIRHYLAPQQLSDLKNYFYLGEHEEQKAQIFSIALTILQVGCLITNPSYYTQQKTLDFQYIQKLLKEFQQRYDQNIAVAIKSMLNRQPQLRSSAVQALQILEFKQNGLAKSAQFKSKSTLHEQESLVEVLRNNLTRQMLIDLDAQLDKKIEHSLELLHDIQQF